MSRLGPFPRPIEIINLIPRPSPGDTGSANQTVAWRCTGGGIWACGLYQAGTAAGAFVVTATPVADPTRMAIAVVTVK